LLHLQQFCSKKPVKVVPAIVNEISASTAMPHHDRKTR
jgi:hypothetical protein